MENAASKISDEVNNMGDTVTIFCGIGNNGGDGLAVARKLYLAGKNVEIVLLGNEAKASEEVKVNLNIVRNLNINITKIVDSNKKDYLKQRIIDSDYVVDALFGVGLNRNIEGLFKEVIEIINKYARYIVSIDIPSGLHGNSGKILNVAINADIVYTIEVLKKGFFINDGINIIKDVKIVNIDIPDFLKKWK